MRKDKLEVCIKQYTLRGVLVAIYSTKPELAKAGFDLGDIKRCCEGKIRQSHGFIWRYGNNPPTFAYTIKARRSKIARPVLCFSHDGKRLLMKYPSINYAAKKIGGRQSGISNCLSGRKGTYYGYIWRYADEREKRSGRFCKKENAGREEHQDED